MDKSTFCEKLGSAYEHSPWVANAVFDAVVDEGLTVHDLDAVSLAGHFEKVFMSSTRDRQLAVLRAHPELACAQADLTQLTADSASEQVGAGLDQCSEVEFAEFARLNTAYREKFGYPCVIAVKGRSRSKILNIFRMRLQNDAVMEYQTAIRQVCRIAQFRIEDVLSD